MQKDGRGHDTAWSSDWPGEGCADHDEPSKVAMSPVADTTAQKVGEAQLTAWTGRDAVPASTTASCPHDEPSNRLATPAVLTEAQKVGETQDTSYCPPVGPEGAGPIATGADQARPFQVTANWPETAVQNVADGHETELSVPFGDAGAGVDHRAPSQNVASPDSSTAAQNEAVGQDTP